MNSDSLTEPATVDETPTPGTNLREVNPWPKDQAPWDILKELANRLKEIRHLTVVADLGSSPGGERYLVLTSAMTVHLAVGLLTSGAHLLLNQIKMEETLDSPPLDLGA